MQCASFVINEVQFKKEKEKNLFYLNKEQYITI